MRKGNYRNGKGYNLPITSAVLMNAAESQKAASIRHQTTKGGEYGIPDMFKELGYGVGKAYHDMSPGQKIVYGLALFAVAGVVADNVVNEGKYTKPVKDKVVKSAESIYKSIVKTPAVAIGADSLKPLAPNPAPTPAPTPANASVTEMPQNYQFAPGIEVVGSDEYKARLESQLEILDTTPSFSIEGMTARQYVEKYLDYLYESLPGTREGCPEEAIGKTGVTCFSIGTIEASTLLHQARHVDQAYGELSNQFNGKPSYPREEDAVKFQAEWVAVKHNFTEERKQEWINGAMKEYESWKPAYEAWKLKQSQKNNKSNSVST